MKYIYLLQASFMQQSDLKVKVSSENIIKNITHRLEECNVLHHTIMEQI